MKRLMIAALTAALVGCQSGESTFSFDEMTYSPGATVFKLFAPMDAQCAVVVGQDSVAMTRMEGDTLLTGGDGAVWTAMVKGDRKGQEYEFVVDGCRSPGVFAKAVTVNGGKGVVVDLRDSDPEGWADDKGVRPERYADWVLYELHHRDFSVGRCDAKYPGKFLALTEPWATEHLKALGITAVHILPSYDFGSVDETRLDMPQYNWGYDPVNYNVPEGSYSTDPTDPLCRVREFKQMVQALHKAGISVVLDVVYNHTYDIDHSNFQRTYPDYYYRQTHPRPLPKEGEVITSEGQEKTETAMEYSNGSGCGNETASEREMMRRFMTESVKYWATEYHIDGFRFDLMGCHDIATMNAIREAVDSIDPRIFIYGEGWSAGQCALPQEELGIKANVSRMPRIAAFSDDMRDALRGPFSDDTVSGWLDNVNDNENDNDNEDENWGVEKMSLMAGIAGMVEHPQVDYARVNYSREPWATEPTQMISYVSCHDDMCLTDRLRASIKGIGEEELVRLDLLAQTAVMTSQGVPFMLSGEELLRTKQGVHNSFESPDSINRLDWTNLERYPQVMDYYSRLIAMRRHHSAFRIGDAEMVRLCLTFLPTASDGVVAYRLTPPSVAPQPWMDEWSDIVVVLNATRSKQSFALPDSDTWTVALRDCRIDEQGIDTVSGTTIVAPQTALIVFKK